MADAPRVGDTPRTSKEPALVDTADQYDGKAEGDSLKPGYVSEYEHPASTAPTAADYRKAGYDIPADAKSGDTVAAYSADSPRTDKEPALVEQPDNPFEDVTPNEFAAKQAKKSVDASPQNKSAAAKVKNK